MWKNPHSVSDISFHKNFQQRLDDQFVQNLLDKIKNSTRFEVLQKIATDESKIECQKYINIIKNPSIRQSFTRLRIDLNILENSKQNINNSQTGGNCPNCSLNVKETTCHLLFICNKFTDIRDNMYTAFRANDQNFDSRNINVEELLKYVLDLRCPENNISKCCELVKNIYDARVELSKS